MIRPILPFCVLMMNSNLHASSAVDYDLCPGVEASAVEKGMKEFGFKETGLDMGCNDPGYELKYFGKDNQVLIALIEKKTRLVKSLTLQISDFKPKALRFTVTYNVAGINTAKGLMTLEMKP